MVSERLYPTVKEERELKEASDGCCSQECNHCACAPCEHQSDFEIVRSNAGMIASVRIIQT